MPSLSLAVAFLYLSLAVAFLYHHEGRNRWSAGSAAACCIPRRRFSGVRLGLLPTMARGRLGTAVSQGVPAHEQVIAVGVEEANDTFGLLEGLDQAVE